MKTNKKICAFTIVTALLMTLFTVSAFAAEKLDQNMSGADMSFGERFEYALQGTVTGMVMVFAVLGLLWGIISLSKVVFHDIPNKKKAEAAKTANKKENVPASVAVAPVEAPAAVEEAAENDAELAAVITAAIAAMIESGDYQNEFVGGFRVVSFKRSSTRAWNKN